MRKISAEEFLFGPETGFDCFGPWQSFEQFKAKVGTILNDYVWENEKVAPRTWNGLPQGGAPFQKFHVPCDETLRKWFADLGKKTPKEEVSECRNALSARAGERCGPLELGRSLGTADATEALGHPWKRPREVARRWPQGLR